MSKIPPLSSLRAFEAAARHGNFTKAGEELNVTHSAISQQVRRLEDHLGCILIQRQGKRLVLTEKGTALSHEVSRAFANIHKAIKKISETADHEPLAINMTAMFSEEWMSPRLSEFRKALPEIDLVINTRFGAVDLVAGEIEFGIKYGDGNWSDLNSELLVTSPYCIVASTEMEGVQNIRTRNDLTRLRWVQEFDTREVQDWMYRHRLVDRDKVKISYLPGNMVIKAVRDGMGVAATARVFVEEDIKADKVVVLFEEGSGNADLGYYFVSRSSARPANVTKFVKWMKRTFNIR